MDQPDTSYPIQFSVDYPDEPLNRLTTFFRLFTVIPILIVLGFLAGGGDFTNTDGQDFSVAAGTAGLLTLAPW